MAWPVLVASLGFLIWQFVLAGVVLDGARELKLQRASARWARSESGPSNNRRDSGSGPQGDAVMQAFVAFLNRLVREEEGQDMVEYALILGLVSIVAVVAVTATGGSVSQIWDAVSRPRSQGSRSRNQISSSTSGKPERLACRLLSASGHRRDNRTQIDRTEGGE